jgi:hypothetical protein
MLDEAPPPFVIHDACSNGVPSDAGNIGYSMLRRGAIATISASDLSYAWDWPNQVTEEWVKPANINGCSSSISAEYAQNVFEGMSAGEALGTTIANANDGHGYMSWYQKSLFNLYGDPLMRMVMCREDTECENNIFCDGEELCQDGFCFPGEPVVCEPTEDCEDMICDEDLGCVESAECASNVDSGTSDTDTDTDTDTEVQDSGATVESMSAESGCTFMRIKNGETSLLTNLIRLLS